MITSFKCKLSIDEINESWTGVIKQIINYGSHYEVLIDSRSSIKVIVGATECGNFACMPDFGVGCHLASFKDTFWNEEQLCKTLGTVDGITVSRALYAIADRL